MHEHLHGQLTKATILQNFSLVLLSHWYWYFSLVEQFASFQRDGEVGRVTSLLLKIQISKNIFNTGMLLWLIEDSIWQKHWEHLGQI